MTTKITCGVINENCVLELKNAYAYLFESETARNTYFSAVPSQLVNNGVIRTMAFVGTTSVNCQYWDGENEPSTYDPNSWADTPMVFNAFSGLTENAITAVDASGQPFDSGMTVDTVAGEIVSEVPIRADIVAPTGSISFEGTSIVSTNGDTLEIHNCVEETTHEVLNVEYDDTGSNVPMYARKSALQEYDVHLISDESSGDFETIFPTINDVHWKNIKVIPTAAGVGRFVIYDNGPEACVLNTETEFVFEPADIGIETIIPLKNRIKLSQGQFVRVTYSGVPLAGHQYAADATWGDQFVPYAKTDSQPYVEEEVNVRGDWDQTTPTEQDFIKNKPRFPKGGGYCLTTINTVATLADTDYKVDASIVEWGTGSDFSWNDSLKRFEYSGPGAVATCIVDLSSANNTNNTHVRYVLCKNGVPIDAVSTGCDFINSNKSQRVGFNCQMTVTTGDYFELCVSVDLAATTVITSNIQFSVFSTD